MDNLNSENNGKLLERDNSLGNLDRAQQVAVRWQATKNRDLARAKCLPILDIESEAKVLAACPEAVKECVESYRKEQSRSLER